MAMDLFDDAGEDDVEEISKIEINEDFAKRYEHNKKREDLQKLDEMKKKGLVNDSGSDSESDSGSELDEDDDDDVRKKEVEFFDALLKVRKKDPILKEKDAKLFESSSEGEDEREGGEEKRREKAKKKPKYLKDVMAQHLMEEGPEFEEEKAKQKVKTYAEEQEHLRESVLEAMAQAERENDDGEEGDFLNLKDKEEEEDDDDEEAEEEIGKRLDEYFGEDEKLDENDKFLKDFFKNKLWMDNDKGKKNIDDDLEEISDDEEAIVQQEDYEREFNFRFEENKSDRVLSHSRVTESSVRKETNARKQQRERKKERLAQAEVERREEVKRLKNLKKKEIQEKLDKIREIAGLNGDSIPLTEEDLEEEFNPDEFDKKMKEAFGDDYYEAEDADPRFGSDGDEGEGDLEKPDFDKEDELLGLPKDWDVIKSNDVFFAERVKKLKSVDVNDEEGGDDDDDDDVDVDDVVDDDNDDKMETQEGKKKRKRKLSLKEKVVLDKELEELYKLDYEDAIGDLKTRFKYRGVAPRKYGLSAAHILWMDDKDLNQYVSLKKLAPYSEKEWAVPRMHRQNMLKKGMLLQAAMSKKMDGKRKRRMDLGEPSGEKSQGEQPIDDESKLSRAAKRRRRQKEKKLPQSRLAAYGKIPSSSKNKSKS